MSIGLGYKGIHFCLVCQLPRCGPPRGRKGCWSRWALGLIQQGFSYTLIFFLWSDTPRLSLYSYETPLVRIGSFYSLFLMFLCLTIAWHLTNRNLARQPTPITVSVEFLLVMLAVLTTNAMMGVYTLIVIYSSCLYLQRKVLMFLLIPCWGREGFCCRRMHSNVENHYISFSILTVHIVIIIVPMTGVTQKISS